MFYLDCDAKGYYPHFFNTPENVNYVGPLPSAEYYGADSMKSKERNAFIKWYNTEKSNHTVFDNENELCSLVTEKIMASDSFSRVL